MAKSFEYRQSRPPFGLRNHRLQPWLFLILCVSTCGMKSDVFTLREIYKGLGFYQVLWGGCSFFSFFSGDLREFG